METFEELARRDEADLRALLHAALLHAALPRVRVWAAWALALRVGTRANAQLVQAIGEEPEPGVRRHLLVVLAGAQETALLEAFAREDPDAHVRAAACRLLAAVLPSGDAGVRTLMLERLAHDASSEVRLEALRALGPARADDHEVGAVAGVLADPDAETRAAALAALIPCSAHVRPEVRALLENEPEPVLRERALAALCASLGSAQLLALSLDAAPTRLQEVLVYLVRVEKARLPWSALAPLAARGVPELDIRVLELLDTEAVEPAARSWLLGQVVRAARLKSAPWSHPALRAGAAACLPLLRALEAARALTPNEHAGVPEVIRWLEEVSRFWEEEELDPPPEGTLEEALLVQLRRLVGAP